MTVFLKQSTASQSVIIGAFVDDTDFKTVETGLTIANTDIKLMKNGAASVNKNSGGATHRINGDYSITLDATDTNTVGELRVSVDVAGALVVWATYQVLEETVFDLYYGSGDTGQVVLQGVTHTGAVIPTVTTLTGHTAQTGDSFARIGAAGAGLTNINLPNQTMDIVGSITGSLSGSVGSVTGAVGSVTAAVTVGTNNDKTGYSISGAKTTLDALNDIAATAIVSAGAITTLTGAVVNVDLVDTLTTYTGDTPQTADHTAAIADIPTVSEFNARTILSADYFDPAADTVALVTDVTTKTGYSISGVLNTLDDLENISATEVNAEVDDVLTVDTQTLPGQAAPTNTPTISESLMWVYKLMRNKTEQTSTLWSLYDDAGSVVDSKATVSDDATTATKEEIVSGP